MIARAGTLGGRSEHDPRATCAPGRRADRLSRRTARRAPDAIAFTDVDQPVFSWGIQCVGSQRRAVLHERPGDRPQRPERQRAVPGRARHRRGPRRARRRQRRWARPGGGAADPVTAGATDSAGIRSLKVLVDGTERASVTFECDFHLAAPCPTPAAMAFDFAGSRRRSPRADRRRRGHRRATWPRASTIVDVDGTPPALDLLSDPRAHDPGVGVGRGVRAARTRLIEVRQSPTKPFGALKTTVRRRAHVGEPCRARREAGDPAARRPTRPATRSRWSRASMSLARPGGPARPQGPRRARERRRTGATPSLTGGLTTTDGAALANQPIVGDRPAAPHGRGPEPFATATDRRGGRFSIPVPAGPSRNLIVTYPGSDGVLHRVRDVSAARAGRLDDPRRRRARVRRRPPCASPGTCARSAPPCRRAASSSICRPPSTAAGRRSPPPAPPASGWRAVARFRGTPGRYPVRLRIRREAVFPYDLGYSPSVIVRVR